MGQRDRGNASATRGLHHCRQRMPTLGCIVWEGIAPLRAAGEGATVMVC